MIGRGGLKFSVGKDSEVSGSLGVEGLKLISKCLPWVGAEEHQGSPEPCAGLTSHFIDGETESQSSSQVPPHPQSSQEAN